MLKKLAALGSMVVLVFSLSAAVFANGAEKEGRVEGRVVRTNKDKSTITVRVRDMEADRVVHYDPSTRWVSQFHGDKTVNTIDASQVKDGDQVICLGSYDDKKQFNATEISKRLSHSPK